MNAITVHSPHAGRPLHCLRLVPNSGILEAVTASDQSQQAEKFEVFLGKISNEAELVKDGAEILTW